MKNKYINLLLIAALPLLAGCDMTELSQGVGQPIRFTANTSYANGVGTRTEYSGEFFGETSPVERINWLSTDIIRIYSEEAVIPGSTNHFADYSISPTANSNEISKASMTAIDNGFNWGSGEHTFYALYPSPATTGVDESKVTLNGNTITGTLPETQSMADEKIIRDSDNNILGYVYKPDMNYAYMWASAQVSSGSDVSLEFTPLVSAWEVTLGNNTSSAMEITSIYLSLDGQGTKLTGDFTATFGGSVVPDETNSSYYVKADLPEFAGGGHLTLAKDQYVTFTLFTMGPLALRGGSYLNLNVQFSNGTTRRRQLFNADGYTALAYRMFQPYVKRRIMNVNSAKYYFDDLDSPTVVYGGGDVSLASAFKSYRNTISGYEPVPFTLEFSETGEDGTWSTTPPSWLTLDSGIDLNGSVTGQDLGSTADAIVPEDGRHDELASRTAKQNFDLSTINVATGATVARTTANCYVVQAPGTYKLPLVYGNGVKNNVNNESAYRAKAGLNATAYRPDDGEYDSHYVSYNGSTFHQHYLGSFKDHLDNNIYNGGDATSSPYLTTHLGKAATDFTPVLIWQDVDGLIQVDATISGSGEDAYLTFSVPAETITQGNAMVAVIVDGAIAWSWHIWVTDEDLTATTTLTSENGWMPVNIGWAQKENIYVPRSCQVRATQAESGIVTTGTITQTGGTVLLGGDSPFYEWGRKDPMQAGIEEANVGTLTNHLSGNFKPYYTENSAYAPVGVNEAASIGTAIQHPYINYHTTSLNGWSSVCYSNLWSSTVSGWNDNVNKNDTDKYDNGKMKTIYDPSPVGFRVPSMDDWQPVSSLTTTKTSYKSNQGWYLNTLFFPMCGLTDPEGNYKFCRVSGYYWASEVDYEGTDMQDGYYLRLLGAYPGINPSQFGVYTMAVSSAYAFSVRPVVDNDPLRSAVQATGQQTQDYNFGDGSFDNNWRNN